MVPFKTLSQEALLAALTEYYERYRKIIEFGADEEVFASCRITLESILNELNFRRGQTKPLFDFPERNNFEFNRIDTKAD